MRTKAKTKTSTALVYNPARKLTVATSNPKKRRKRTRKNPARRRVLAGSHRRRRNPSYKQNPSITGLIGAALMAGVGVTLFDILVNRFLPIGQSGLVRAGVKLGGAYLFNSSLGSKIPLLSKYKGEIALVLAVSGVVDLMKMFVLPLANQVTGGWLLGVQTAPQQLIPAQGVVVPTAAEMSGYWDEDGEWVWDDEDDEEDDDINW